MGTTNGTFSFFEDEWDRLLETVKNLPLPPETHLPLVEEKWEKATKLAQNPNTHEQAEGIAKLAIDCLLSLAREGVLLKADEYVQECQKLGQFSFEVGHWYLLARSLDEPLNARYEYALAALATIGKFVENCRRLDSLEHDLAYLPAEFNTEKRRLGLKESLEEARKGNTRDGKATTLLLDTLEVKITSLKQKNAGLRSIKIRRTNGKKQPLRERPWWEEQAKRFNHEPQYA